MVKYVISLIVVLVVICMICSCSNDETSQKQLIFHVVDSTTFHFEGLNSLGISDSLIYISNYFDNSIHCLSFDSTERCTFGGSGKGPGEFTLPGAIAMNGDTVAVADMTENQIELFDSRGNFLQTLRLDSEYLIIGFTSFFFCHNDLYYETIKMGSFDEDFMEKIITYKMSNLKDAEIIKTYALHSTKDNCSYPIETLATLFPYRDSYVEVENDNNLIIKDTGEHISLLSIPKEKIGSDIKKFIRETGDYENSQINFPAYYPRVLYVFEIDNILFVLSFAQSYNNLIDPHNNILYYYDEKHNVFREMALPDYMPVSNLEIVKNNVMVFVDREKEEIFLFKVEI